MWPKGCTPRWWQSAGGSDRVATGPAITTLRVAATRTASIIRCVGIVSTVVQVIIWHSFYLTVPWRLAGPVVAVAWGSAAVMYLLRRWPVWPLAAVDSGVYVVLALCARWCLPPLLRGDGSNWLYIVTVGQLVAPAWFTPTTMLAVLALASGAAYWAGAALTPAAGSGPASPTTPATAVLLLLAVVSAAWCGRRMLRRRAVEADAALERADQDSRAQYVVLSRQTERREHERLLHDTVLNTLTALARAGASSADVVSRCRDDVRLIERVLGDPDDTAAAAWPPYDGLLAGIEAVAHQMRSRGLDVHVEVAASAEPAVPAQVARAMAHAVREALVNVASHAGTSEAWIEVGLAEEGGLRVTVRDAGAGFHPDRVGPGRLGLQRSIVERIADQGGQASVTSAPGQGTVVSLRWAAPPRPADAAIAGSVSGWGGAPW
jgi:signal transduction histidine kinase